MKKLMALTLALLVCTAANAQQPVNERAAADPDGKVEISNVAGTVTVQGWDRNEVEVTGTLSKEVERLEFKASGKHTLVKVVIPKNSRNIGRTDLTISIPAASRLRVDSVSADILVRGVSGEQGLETVSGEINSEVVTQELDAETVSGDIVVAGQGKVGRLKLTAVSGDIKVSGVAGEISASVVSGDIEVREASLDRADLSTVNGDLDVQAKAEPDARFKLETINGKVDLALAGEINAEFDVETFNGRIKNCFGQSAESTRSHGPGSELQFVQGDGSARISIDTLNGRINICGQ